MKILILNGPNLNLLGKREPLIYGNKSMIDVLEDLREEFIETEILYSQSNHEGFMIDAIQEDHYDALVINPGAYSHYSYAIADALKNVNKPVIEVHISNIYQREDFRQKSVTATHCNAVLSGFGVEGYKMAIHYLISILKGE